MRIKLDEDLSKSVRNHIASLGYDVTTVVSQGWGGTEDVDLWPRIVAEKIFWVTADKGFDDIRAHPPGTPEKLIGALTVASHRLIRIRCK
jgi:predicted nuclease of predicted toxin-antitoxin system